MEHLKIWFGVATGRPQGGHVVGFSWPFDRPRGRSRSGELRSFYEKPLSVFGNQPALQTSSQIFLQKTPHVISKSTRSPERMHTGLFEKKTCTLSKFNPRSIDTLIIFCENILWFLSNQKTVHLSLFLFFSQKKNMWGPCTARMSASEGLVSSTCYSFLARATARGSC